MPVRCHLIACPERADYRTGQIQRRLWGAADRQTQCQWREGHTHPRWWATCILQHERYHGPRGGKSDVWPSPCRASWRPPTTAAWGTACIPSHPSLRTIGQSAWKAANIPSSMLPARGMDTPTGSAHARARVLLPGQLLSGPCEFVNGRDANASPGQGEASPAGP